MPHSANITTIFIDDGDVMNDNEMREPQWRRLLGEYFVPRLGGTFGEWREANRVVFESQWDVVSAGHGDEPFMQWWDRCQSQWMRGMADRVGVAKQASDKEWTMMAREASEFVTRRVQSAYPGAIEAIRALSEQGFDLHTASNEVSWELNGYLIAMGVRELFGTLYGPDLIDADKHSDNYYRRMFEGSAVDPAEAVVVDNSSEYLDRAASAGAMTFIVSRDASADTSEHRVIGSLAELPAALVTLSP